jgi:hypothetical protein
MTLKLAGLRAGLLTLCASVAMMAVAQTTPTPKWETSKLDNGARHLSYYANAPQLGKPTPFMVNFFCYPLSTKTEKGMLGIEIYVDNVASLKPFKFDDFDGPDAATNGKKLLRIAVNRPGKPAYVVDSMLSGWTPGPKNFAFGIAEESRRAKSVEKTVLQALAEDAESLQLTVTDPRNPKLKLEFRVPIAEKRAEFKTLLTGLK